MNIPHLKTRLTAKQRELQEDISRLGNEARASAATGVRDTMDDAVSSEAASESLQEGALASQTLLRVQDALQRIDAGSYGTCFTCGRPIEGARLEAIPWALYCLDDQQKQDQATHAPLGGSTL